VCVQRPKSVGTLATVVVLHLRGPEREVVADELHNRRSILVLIIIDVLDVSDGIIERLLGQVACLSRVVEAFIVEDGEVKGKAQADRVRRLELSVGDLRGSRVGLKGALRDLLVEISFGVLGNVAVIITLHLEVKDARLGGRSLLDQVRVEEVKDVLAVGREFVLELLLIVADKVQVVRVLALLFLLDGGDRAPGRAAAANAILVGDRKQVALFNGQLLIEVVHNLLDVIEHVLEALRLLADARHIDVLFACKGHFFLRFGC